MYTISRHKHTRFWAIHHANGALVAVVVYLRGARELVRVLAALEVRP